MNIIQTLTFIRKTKKLHKNQKLDLDEAIKNIAKDPFIGQTKKGDLSGIRVYKFKMVDQLTLLAYEFYQEDPCLVLLALGPHENFIVI